VYNYKKYINRFYKAAGTVAFFCAFCRFFSDRPIKAMQSSALSFFHTAVFVFLPASAGTG
jgi:hypothetical protein